jgi:serine phosphatase RsbU (regulator of sigma subunit)
MKFDKNISTYLLNGFILVVGWYLLQNFYPKIHPLSQTDFKITHEAAVQKAKELVKGEIPEPEEEIKTSFIIDANLYRQQDNLQPVYRALQLQPGRYWDISLISSKNKRLNITLGENQVESVRDMTGKWYKIKLAPDGRLLELDFQKPLRAKYKDTTTVNVQNLSGENSEEMTARHNALIFLQHFVQDTAGLTLVSREFKQDSLGQIFDFTFSEIVADHPIYHQVKVASANIVYYKLLFTLKSPPTELSEKGHALRIAFGITSAIIFISIFIFLVIYLIRLLRKEAISFKIALPVVYFMAFITILQTIFDMWQSAGWIIVIGVIPTTLIYAVGILFLFAITDSLARQEWSEKLTVTDLFLQGRFLTPATGKSLLQGIYLGVLSLTAFVMPLFIIHHYFGETFYIKEDLNYSLVLLFPVFTLGIKYLTSSIFKEYFYRLFSLTLLKKWLHKNLWIIGIGMLLTFTFSTEIEAGNPLINLLLYIIPTILFIYFLLRFEIMTTIVGFFSFQLLAKMVIFSKTNEPYFQEQGLGFYFLLGALLLFALLLVLVKRKGAEQETQFIPDYIRKLEEKERLARELEIARNIQLQFLPKATPVLAGYQIGAYCQPAWEVGGDYFDYFEMADNKLGFVIGDVSNKGVSAAFFMTLVKGFLKALATDRQNPLEILCQTNQLFYKNVERGHFISMVFGILDGNSGEFRFARAGHNPILMLVGQSTKGEWFTPKGAGIGLLPDERFREIIAEEKIWLQPDDVLVLYTDGYPEAMNDKSREFGEESLQGIIAETREKTPEEIIRHLEIQIKKWMGSRPPLDDRTIIVIKRGK